MEIRKLTPHQQEVFETIMQKITSNIDAVLKSDDMEDHFLSLSGAAGTGKSFLTIQLIEELSKRCFQSQGNVCLTAPTNKAVKVLADMMKQSNVTADCRTIHSFLNIKPVKNYKNGEETFKILRTKNRLPKASLLIIDESSMVSKELLNFIIEAYNRGQVNTVLFIGDPFQLLPVDEKESSIFKLRAQYRLTKIIRQAKDSNIIKLATKVRERIQKQDFSDLRKLFKGVVLEDIELFDNKEAFLQDFHKNQEWQDEDKILTSFTNDDVEIMNKYIRNQYWQERAIDNPKHILAGDCLRFKSALESNKKSISLRPALYQNGDEVKIKTAELIRPKKALISFWECTVVGRPNSESFRVIDPDSLDDLNKYLENYIYLAKTTTYPYNKQYWKMYFDLKNAFADVQYIYASTIHKLQGSTFDTIYIDLSRLVNNERISNDLRYRLAYVAITRARKNVKILV
ncbi:MAG: AAA family ATPase [Campylobacterota bacterium]|nr:AAA family ATPase [Campylobacterota bacterium]